MKPARPISRLDDVLQRPAVGPLLALLLALPALLPLLRPGFFVSDDGRFHVYRIAALADAWRDGVLHPRLFPDFGFGYGQAVLNFYSPLSYWPGAVLALLGLSPAAAAQVVIALGFVLAALAAYGYARYLWGPAAGLMAAIAYTYFPYHLADAYLRGALPEHMAFIWLPLILWTATAAFRRAQPLPPLLWGSLAWAGLVLTHNLTALLMALATAPYLLLLAWRTGRWRRLVGMTGSLLLALGLSAGYWLPVLAESGSVGIGLGASDGYRNHLVSFGRLAQARLVYVYEPAAHPLSWPTLALAGLAVLLAIRHLARGRPLAHRGLLGFGLLLLTASILMMTQAALPLWRLTQPVLGHLQYPWRFLMLAGLGLLLVAATLPALWPARGRRVGLAIVAGLLVAVPLLRLQVAPLALSAAETWSPQRMWQEDAEAGQVGATWTGEFLPLAVTEQRWALGRPRQDASDGPALAPVPQITIEEMRYAGLTARVQTEAPFALRLHQFHLPGWNARIDGQPAPTYPSGELALVTVDVPAGDSQIEIRFGATPARTAGALLSALAALAWVILARRLLPLPLGEGRGEGSLPLPLGEGRGEGSLPLPLGEGQGEGSLPLPLEKGRREGSLPLPLGEGRGEGSLPLPLEKGRREGSLPLPLGEGRGEGSLPLPLEKGRREGSLPLPLEKGRGEGSAALALLLLTLLLGLNALGLGQRSWTPRPVQAQLEDVALLLASDARPAQGQEAIEVVLYWLALRENAENYKAFVHLLGPDGAVIAQHDGAPGGSFTPTTRWRQGEIIADRHLIPLPAGLPAGDYGLRAGLYQLDPLRNLSVDPPAADNRVDLGTVPVR